jgi:hypothetical protein
MFDAIVDDHERWLNRVLGEAVPQVVAEHRPDAVIIEPWVDPVLTAVEIRITPEGLGATLTVLAYSDRSELSEDERKRTRYRLGTLFGAALREWVDEPHS